MPSMAEWTRIAASGATVITGTTIIASLYLLVILYKQGRGKLRVRLLLGMVVSDLLLGVIVLPSEVASLAGHPIQTGTAICGFFLTAVLWQQHLWTLSIATATYLLLKYPLSSKTTFLERYSWICAPAIWSISFLHSGIWWRYEGWVSNGNLCYYQNTLNATGVGASDLIQFIPRAIVFLSILIIYSALFQFLRRPDTIQLSSQFVSGSVLSTGPAEPKTSFLRRFSFKKPAPSPPRVDPNAPWEAVEFVKVGGKSRGQISQMFSPEESNIRSPTESRRSATFTSPIMSVDMEHMPVPLPIPIDTPALETPNEKYQDSFSLHSLDTSRRSSKKTANDASSISGENPLFSNSHTGEIHIVPSLSPIASGDKSERPLSPDLAQSPVQEQNQTLIEFFQEYEPQPLDVPAKDADKTRRAPQMSATAYFNRQASLLMLYFPLAYLIVFSLSIARLIYNMASSVPNPLLTTISSWFVLAVGVVDGLVYGLAEFLVRRRVRKNMPDRMG